MDESVSDDAFLGGRLSVLQPRAAAYRAGIDAVLLAAAVPAQCGVRERVLDAGSGVGVVGLSVAARVKGATVTLVERDAELLGLARRNAERNGLGDRVTAIAADIAEGGAAPAWRADSGLAPASFDHVAANPPFHGEGRGTPSPHATKAAAHAMRADDLDAWLRFLATGCRDGGTLTMIHHAAALGALLAAATPRFGGLRLLPVHPREGKPANRILIRGIKGSRAPLTLLPGLVLHAAEGQGFLPAVDAVLRDGAPLTF